MSSRSDRDLTTVVHVCVATLTILSFLLAWQKWQMKTSECWLPLNKVGWSVLGSTELQPAHFLKNLFFSQTLGYCCVVLMTRWGTGSQGDAEPHLCLHGVRQSWLVAPPSSRGATSPRDSGDSSEMWVCFTLWRCFRWKEAELLAGSD